MKSIKHGVLAMLVFVLLTGGFLWLTGTFSSGKSASAKAPDSHDKKEEAEHGDHAENKTSDKDEKKPLSLAEIETKKCEHNIRQLDCNECRYELGVVKVAPSVTGALVTTAKTEKRELVQKLRVTGEVQFDQTRVVDVVPVAAGRIISIKARLGQQVKQGDLLAILHVQRVRRSQGGLSRRSDLL